MFSSRRKSLFLIFLSCVTISFVFCSETENVSVKTENLDVPSAEVADERDAIQAGALELEHEVVNEQADQPTSGERFVAIHVDTMGMREELSPTLLGLTHLALTFLPAEYQFLTVISAAREVVAGVRFILVVNAERVETGERVVCGMEILEKPWITTEWGEKWRMLERTNCTGSPNPLAPDKNQYSQVNPIFTEREKEVSEERMKEVEKQIITSTTPRDFYEVHDTTTELPLEGLSDEMKALLDAFFQTSAVPRPGAPKPNSWSIVRENVAQVDGGVRGELEEEKIEPKTAYPQGITEDSTVVSSTEAFIEITPTPLSNEVLSSSQITENPQYFEEDLGQQQIIDPFLQIDPANQPPPNDNVQEQVQEQFQEPLRQKRELGVTEKEEILLLLNRALQQLDVIDEDSSRRLAIDIYHVKVSRDGEQCKTVAAHAKVANSQCSEGEDENLQDCMENVFPETTKLCAIEATLCNDKSLKLKKTICKPIPEKKSREKRGNVPGGVNEIDLNDLKDESHPLHDLVRESLAGLSEKEMELRTAIISSILLTSFVRINSATKQVVAGMLYKVNLDVKDSNAKEVQCNLRIWERAWLNPSKEIDFDCNNSKKFKFTRARRSVDDAEQPHPVLVGGPTPIDVDNDDKVKELTSSNCCSNEKVVAGVLYEIKAEFRSTGESKEIVTCNLSVWERPWLKVDNSQTDVACDNAKKYKFTRSRRSVDAEQPHPVLGGPTPIDVEKDEKVKNLVQNSLVLHRIVEATKKIVQGVLYEIKVEFRSTGDSKEVVTFVRINSATKQVVAGMLYKVNLDVKDSNAKEVQCNLRIWERAWLNPSKEIDFDCNNSKKFKFTRARRSVDDAEQPHPVLVESKEIVTCNLSVWERPWLKVDNSQTDVACDNAKKYKFTRSRRSVDAEQPHPVLGGPTPIDVEKDEKVKNLVQNSLVLHRIVEATKKIVQGVLYEIKVEFRSTGDSKEVVTCNLSVWERPWLKEESSQTDVSCNNDKKYTFRAKRSLIYDHRRRAEDDEDEQRQLMNQRDTLARHEALFHKFQLKFGRAYHSSMEKSLRFRIFQNNLAKIEQLNEREQGTAKYGITQFADLTPSEYRMKTGLWRREFDENHISNPIAEIPNIKLPKSFDWRDKNAVSEVKNQGSCGSCWAFSVTGNIEGLYAIKTGQLEEFSEQELVDCDTIDGGVPEDSRIMPTS
uniref:Cysteine proteinase n=2 Tax=Lutzomyia longipalpis TaxID=7200 RepID=A0A1B0CK31_LUTLO